MTFENQDWLLELPADLDPLRARIVRYAQSAVPLLEDPPYSNHSPVLDRLCDRWGVPPGSYWCGLLAAEVWLRAGADLPPITASTHPARVEDWRTWAIAQGLFITAAADAQLGDAVLFGAAGKPPCHHIAVCVAGIVIDPAAGGALLWDIEGNTSESGYSANGELATAKRTDLAHVVGFVRPRARTTPYHLPRAV